MIVIRLSLLIIGPLGASMLTTVPVKTAVALLRDSLGGSGGIQEQAFAIDVLTKRKIPTVNNDVDIFPIIGNKYNNGINTTLVNAFVGSIKAILLLESEGSDGK